MFVSQNLVFSIADLIVAAFLVWLGFRLGFNKRLVAATALVYAVGNLCNTATIVANGNGTMPVYVMRNLTLNGKDLADEAGKNPDKFPMTEDTRLQWLADRYYIINPVMVEGRLMYSIDRWSLGDILIKLSWCMVPLVLLVWKSPIQQAVEPPQTVRRGKTQRRNQH